MTGPDTRHIEEIAALYAQRRHPELEAAARRWLQSLPGEGMLWKALGIACLAQNKIDEAVESHSRAVALLPGDAEAAMNLGHALAAAGRAQESARWFERACALKPDSVDAFVALGCALRDAKNPTDAVKAFQQALRLDARHTGARMNLGITLAISSRPAAAEEQFRAALEINPSLASAHSNMGNLLRGQGRHGEALEHLREAVRLQPDLAAARSNELMTFASMPGVDAAQVRSQARQFGEWVNSRARAVERAPAAARTGAIRVGLVSGDLRDHPVGCFLDAVLAHWPRERVALFAYPTMPAEDAVTQRLRHACAAWRPIHRMDDAQAAALIAGDRIDVLVDLSGHTGHNRLPLFGFRPAPVQATWLGYFGTTGVEQIDWILSDEASTPPGAEGEFTERVWRLPRTRHCFTAPADAPAVAPSPAKSQGWVTFGSFQARTKISDCVLDLWARVLRATPASRMRLQGAWLDEPAAREWIAAQFEDRGVERSRLALSGPLSRPAFWQAHAEVDVLLDTFPYCGATTTCEALWMGVPTITLSGELMISRLGRTLLNAAGLAQCIAAEPETYVAKAVALASDVGALAALRGGLREKVASSALMDASRFAANLADALIAMAEPARDSR